MPASCITVDIDDRGREDTDAFPMDGDPSEPDGKGDRRKIIIDRQLERGRVASADVSSALSQKQPGPRGQRTGPGRQWNNDNAVR